ncbi:PREDICTED: poly(rC)-binding protein 3-like isoform X2 [Priapulus caudatus]|uniref:Poly(RC)-binding protein 3-like isoform X2 n=1 Tax=Priapulus caudatus TaxID=37621 RepID=A0ABM1DQB1_PRICU|nr:PREDICTED: poly(rC)-binding protein 3-like isoform X2 [Priapulus caudatus]
MLNVTSEIAMENMRNSTSSADGPSPSLTVRVIMQGKEVGSIIGKKGDNIKKFREESGAKINISDGSCPERIVTVTGHADTIYKAFGMISRKLEEDILSGPNSNVPKPPVTIRLIVPASQCGSLIGKGGCKIKEIREVTGASIQVASEMLPNSTERAVTVSGTADAITQCVYHICCVMLEQMAKMAHLQHMGQLSPLLGGAQALPGGAIPAALLAAAASGNFAMQRPAAPMPNSLPTQAQSHEMTIPNDLIGCIIGRGGAKINEIRHLSGAAIKIANQEDGSTDRAVTITGAPEAVSMAQYLINASIELYKATNPGLDASGVVPPPSATSTAAAAAAAATLTAASAPFHAGATYSLIKQAPFMGGLSMGYYDVCNNFGPKFLTTKIRPNFIPLTNGVKKIDHNKFSPY